jgi:hypothetical protein
MHDLLRYDVAEIMPEGRRAVKVRFAGRLLLFESCLCEMLIEGEGCPDSKPFHNKERGTICEGIGLVCVLNEIAPRLSKDSFIDMNQFDRRAFQ